MTDPVTRTLLGAADFLDLPGRWQQGFHLRHRDMQPENLPPDDERDDDFSASEAMKDPTIVCACMEGAIYRAAPDDAVAEQAIGRMTGYLCQIDPDANVPEWNDEQGRTAAEVVLALRKAAVREPLP